MESAGWSTGVGKRGRMRRMGVGKGESEKDMSKKGREGEGWE
jgi:hypothetical protein